MDLAKLCIAAATYTGREARAGHPRVWRDEIAALGRDLRVWVRKLPEADGWTPTYFEYSFGLSDEGRDERSVAEPVTIDGRFILRGSVDVIETQDGIRRSCASPITRPAATARRRGR